MQIINGIRMKRINENRDEKSKIPKTLCILHVPYLRGYLHKIKNLNSTNIDEGLDFQNHHTKRLFFYQ